ncbi:MAG: hypothetical protein JO114_24260 [Planctomycetaceae bacterium]|nr:hypothetical protein [Planctomycetaceae bacterium]MBV8310107.1 hypothetical protein [Planctomycetaceae bacterium]
MRWIFRSGGLGAVGLMLVAVGARFATAANLPVGSLGVTPAAQGEYGTIKGRLVWGGSDVPPARALIEKGRAQKDPEICAREAAIPNRELVVDPKTKGVVSGFAYLVKPKGSNPGAVKELLTRSPKAELDQKNCEFLPYVLAIHQDQTLVIKSSDPVNHNVRYAAFANSPFNQIMAPKGEIEVKLVAERRPIVVACDIHSWMKAYIMVFDHPFFAVTGADGAFEIKGVPAGEQNLVLWQERVGYVGFTDPAKKAQGRAVTIRAGEVTDLGSVAIDPAQVK